MMLAYGVGRLGCHFSGDGDWGDPNRFEKPLSILPDWLWAYRYPNNVINEGTLYTLYTLYIPFLYYTPYIANARPIYPIKYFIPCRCATASSTPPR